MSVDPQDGEPRYLYVGDRPTWGVDPSGEETSVALVLPSDPAALMAAQRLLGTAPAPYAAASWQQMPLAERARALERLGTRGPWLWRAGLGRASSGSAPGRAPSMGRRPADMAGVSQAGARAYVRGVAADVAAHKNLADALGFTAAMGRAAVHWVGVRTSLKTGETERDSGMNQAIVEMPFVAQAFYHLRTGTATLFTPDQEMADRAAYRYLPPEQQMVLGPRDLAADAAVDLATAVGIGTGALVRKAMAQSIRHKLPRALLAEAVGVAARPRGFGLAVEAAKPVPLSQTQLDALTQRIQGVARSDPFKSAARKAGYTNAELSKRESEIGRREIGLIPLGGYTDATRLYVGRFSLMGRPQNVIKHELAHVLQGIREPGIFTRAGDARAFGWRGFARVEHEALGMQLGRANPFRFLTTPILASTERYGHLAGIATATVVAIPIIVSGRVIGYRIVEWYYPGGDADAP